MSKEPRLHLRGNTYYFRAKIPPELRAHYGKWEIKHSLKTKDYHLARRLVRQHSVRVDQEFEALRITLGKSRPNRLHLDDHLIQTICDSWEYNALAGDELTRHNDLSDEVLDQMEAERLTIDRDLRKALARGRTELIQPVLDTYLHLMRIELSGSSQERNKLLRVFLKAVTKANSLQILRDKGEIIDTPTPVSHSGTKEGKQLMLEDLFEAWKLSYEGRNQKTIDAMEAEIPKFQVVVGIKPAEQYKKADVIRYRNHLIGEKQLKGKTVKKRIGFLRAMYQVAIEDELLQVNPARSIKVKTSNVKTRLPFKIDELKRIFSCPLYTRRERPEGGKREAAAWLPLIALFTGCREEEIGQLRTGDVLCEYGVWYFNLIEIDDDEDKRTRLKTASSSRRMPIHPSLVQAGFLKYVEQIRGKGSVRLFPELLPNKYGVLTANWGKWFNRYLDNKIGIDDPTRVFYSFRHNFSDACREAGLPDELKDTLMGHAKSSKDSTGRSYGIGYSLKNLYEAISLIEYPGVPVPQITTE